MSIRMVTMAAAASLAVASVSEAQDAPVPATDTTAVVTTAPPAPTETGWDPSIRRFTATVSPFHFGLGFEGAFEFLASPNIGIVGIFGTGGEKKGDVSYSFREFGGQIRYYFRDNGKGTHLGGEFINIGVDADADEGTMTGMASGNAFGGFIGWKGVWGPGFTFVAQGGYTFMSVDASATDGKSSESKSGSGQGLLLNLDAGWSF